MIEVTDAGARRALDAPLDGPPLALCGPPGSGKSATLARRVAALVAREPSLRLGEMLVLGADAPAAARLRARVLAALDERRAREAANVPTIGTTLDRVALAILREHADRTGMSPDLDLVPPWDAETIFTRAAAPLFSAEWNEWVGAEIDPDVAGLRAPQRFATAAYRLIRKLRDARIDPPTFLREALRAATTFYANPPNFAAPSLLLATKDRDRSSLAVDAAELDRQRRREIDLAKILTKLYEAYGEALVARGCLAAGDAIAEATRLIAGDKAVAAAVRGRFRAAFVDDAQDLRPGEIALLEALLGERLHGLTIAGDPALATRTFAGARADRVFERAERCELAGTATPGQLLVAARAIVAPTERIAVPAGAALRLHRASDAEAEAAFVADSVAAHVHSGIPARRIAVLGRTLRTMGHIADALVARNVPVALRGDGALGHRADVLDALALLWCTADPFRHAWTLRVLALPFVGLSDASIAVLCSEPPDAQAALFTLPDVPAADDGDRRWDRRRDVRLGINLLRGDRDSGLGAEARSRVEALRARRDGWLAILRANDVATAARAIVSDGGALAARSGESAARVALRRSLVERLLTSIEATAAARPGDDLGAILDRTVAALAADEPPEIDDRRPDAVVVGAIDRAKAERFAHVFVVDVRAGAFPPYYVPDAFLYSPQFGMVPKDAAGDATAARTAKFTWYLHHAKTKERYAAEARRLLAVGMTLADETATLSAAGRATRGNGAPELLVELQSRIPEALVPAPPPAALPETRAPEIAGVALEPRAAAATGSLEEAIGLCRACAVRERAAARAVAPLLRGAQGAGFRLVAHDVAVAFPYGGRVVATTLDAIATDGRARYIVAGGRFAAEKARLLAPVLDDVARDAFVRKDADGSFAGPIALANEDRMRNAICPQCGESPAPV